VRLILLAVLALSCGASTNQSLIAQAVEARCQVEALHPLLLDPENATAAQVRDAVAAIKACSAAADAGPTH
jgi:hypothetical protein